GAAPVVEGKLRQRDAVIADAAEHELALDRLALVRRPRDEPPALLLEPVVHELDRIHLVVTVERDRRTDEEETDGDGFPGRLAARELAQDVHVPSRVRVVLQRGFANSVELELRRIDDDVRTRQLPHLLELLRRPRCLSRPAPADNED